VYRAAGILVEADVALGVLNVRIGVDVVEVVAVDVDGVGGQLEENEVALELDVRALDADVHALVEAVGNGYLDAFAVRLLALHPVPARSDVGDELLLADGILLAAARDLQAHLFDLLDREARPLGRLLARVDDVRILVGEAGEPLLAVVFEAPGLAPTAGFALTVEGEERVEAVLVEQQVGVELVGAVRIRFTAATPRLGRPLGLLASLTARRSRSG